MPEFDKQRLAEELRLFCEAAPSVPGSGCPIDGACGGCPVQAVRKLLGRLPDMAKPAPMTADRAKQIAYQAIQLIREERERDGHDPADTDDWMFSEMDIEKSELEEIFRPYGVHCGTRSCFDDGTSPKNYDREHFTPRGRRT